MMDTLSIYFHKDFDGLVSAALLSRIFKDQGKYKEFNYIPVDHDLKETWLQKSLDTPAAVLDFFYHPDAIYFYDHHSVSFLDPAHERPFLASEYKLVDPSYKSTPSMLKHLFKDTFDFRPFEEVVKWSDRIDNAEYTSPREIYDNRNQYILLNKIITHFYQESNKLLEIIPYIMNTNLEEYMGKYQALLDQLLLEEKTMLVEWRSKVTNEKNICIFDQSDTSLPLQRFLPYYYYPHADYVLSIYKKYTQYGFVISYNPWKDKNSSDLGEVVKRFGGYGRKNVAGVLCQSHKEALQIVASIRSELSL